MSIDLNKPIRSKETGRRVYVDGPSYLVRDDASDHQLSRWSLEELDRFFENVPETRKPREWWLGLDENGRVERVCSSTEKLRMFATDPAKSAVRVIECLEET